MRLRAAWTVFAFEIRRALTWRRLLQMAIALIPVGLIAMVQHQGGHLERNDRAGLALFFLIPQVLCLLALLLWATPAIYAEVEAKTWTYLAVRPAGREAILAGKYLAAVTWTVACAGLSLVLCLGVLAGEVASLRLGLQASRRGAGRKAGLRPEPPDYRPPARHVERRTLRALRRRGRHRHRPRRVAPEHTGTLEAVQAIPPNTVVVCRSPRGDGDPVLRQQ